MASQNQALLQTIAKAADQYPKPPVTFGYGTAGFRTLGERLPSVIFRVGMLAVLRSQRLNGATIGVMVTASHNPEPDNGVKLVDPAGEMLEQSWEAHATALANCETTESLIGTYEALAAQLRVDINSPASVVYAYDTRPSGPALIQALEAGLGAFGGRVKTVNLGITTTPVLHYVVKATNDKSGTYGAPTIKGYYEKLATALKTLVGNRAPLAPLYVDCANGVGAVALEEFGKCVEDIITFKPLNTDTKTKGALNSQCGADFVKTRQQLPPSVAEAGVLAKPETRGASFDGDADRIVYYYLRDGKNFRLLDGDKIAVLAALFIEDLVKRAKLQAKIKVGVVQTAYANGSSTKFIKERNIPVTCTATGVKHLHHAALKYDVGVYFEANGHGTVLFSSGALETLHKTQPNSPEEDKAIKNLLALSELINQAVGDALSDLLLVEVVLAHRAWGAAEWDAGYEDLPNRLVKVEVPDRTIFLTTDAERKLTSPVGLQKLIDEAVAKVDQGRSFVRPSGTEDCVRVYAEAATTASTEQLAAVVTDLVKQAAAAIATA
ncbi:phosphoacetylglucosamine mutase [Cutaneotrichosporon oleaginosum]|uniref:Phosphoacetylglucosamine mutase n=1 Tax=Cutaneotrichosporon oleaginosum TaxID=879819 RepID=A0A0J1B1Q6_9TREE|nr:phosphoacetylglucosamine mutase [Cutaneotrichosporon oleaginosum]KLT41559.1 phosphoacetylglucosamine mutase [Cutaneotrichosporon oleaginosum]TXT09325.1 hypothetical protein COLE_03259 [Cutaneotrichosporon oleaginosum]